LLGGQRLRRVTAGPFGAWEADGEGVAGLRGGDEVVVGQPAQERVQRDAVLPDRRAHPPGGDEVLVVAGDRRGGHVLGAGVRAEPGEEPPARPIVRALRLRPGDERGGERGDELGGRRNELADDRRCAAAAADEGEDLVDGELRRDYGDVVGRAFTGSAHDRVGLGAGRSSAKSVRSREGPRSARRRAAA
jgi:hypothetical protein